jgi:6-phosphogluconolactonase
VSVNAGTARTQAMLLLGWLASRLGWRKLKRIENGWRVHIDNRDIMLRLGEGNNPELHEVVITTDRRSITVSLTHDNTCIIATDSAAQRLPDRRVGSLIGGLVDHPTRDPIFLDAVHASISLNSGGSFLYQVPIIVTDTAQSLARLAARYVIQIARDAIGHHGRFTVSLSGGTTPQRLYSLLAEPPYRDEIDWSKVYVFWGDERDVPITHPDSDQRMSYETLLSKVPIPPNNIFNIRTGQMTTVEAAALYAKDVAAFFGVKAGEIPVFDLMLLGFGADGHTASLFPNTPALDAHGLVVQNDVPQMNTTRVTFTYDLINNAEHIILLGSGSGKADMVAEIVMGTPDKYPVQRVKPTHGTMTLMLDQDAAAKVKAQLD